MVKLRVLFDRIIVQVDEFSKTAGGILLPQDVSIQLLTGKIIGIGHGMLNSGQIIPMPVAVGDRVIFDKHAIVEVQVNDDVYSTIRINDVMGVIENA